MSNLEWFKFSLVWKKPNGFGFLHAKNMPLMAHEDICVFSGGKIAHVGTSENRITYNPQKTPGKPYKKAKYHNGADGHRLYRPSNQDFIGLYDGERYPHSVIEFSKVNKNSVHPTQKPVALYEYLIRTYTNEGDTVLDFCAGSGTTGVAAINTGRHFIGVELREDYADIARARIAKAAEQTRQLELL
jgi:site-specific DNA-methyltransferase (adenine-specific)